MKKTEPVSSETRPAFSFDANQVAKARKAASLASLEIASKVRLISEKMAESAQVSQEEIRRIKARAVVRSSRDV